MYNQSSILLLLTFFGYGQSSIQHDGGAVAVVVAAVVAAVAVVVAAVVDASQDAGNSLDCCSPKLVIPSTGNISFVSSTAAVHSNLWAAE